MILGNRLVRYDMDVNEHERLSNMRDYPTLQKNSAFIVVLHFTICFVFRVCSLNIVSSVIIVNWCRYTTPPTILKSYVPLMRSSTTTRKVNK